MKDSGNDTQRGFSFIELLVVFAVISLLTGFGLFGLSGFRTGYALQSARDEVILIFQSSRSLAVSTGAQITVRIDAANRMLWAEDANGNRKTNRVQLESGVQITGPSQIIFTGTGSVASGQISQYTFRAPRSSKILNLVLYPKTGRAEAG